MLTSILHKLHYHCHYHSSNILQISFQHSSNILHPHHHSSIILQISFTILPTFFQYPSTSFQHLSTILQPSNTISPLYPVLPSQSYVKKGFFNDEVLLKDILSLTLTLGWKNKKQPSGPIELDLEAGNLVEILFCILGSITAQNRSY